MRLNRLNIERLGALSNAVFSFTGRLTVLRLPNEGGKTTFVDALISALYGDPAKRGPKWEEFEARYGDSREDISADLERAGDLKTFRRSDKKRVPWIAESVFKTLLTIRSGECPPPKNDDFIERFMDRVLGGGILHVQEALSSLDKFNAGKGNAVWYKTLRDLREEILTLTASLSAAGELSSSNTRRRSLEGQVQEEKNHLKCLKLDQERLTWARQALRSARLVELKSRLQARREKAARLGTFTPEVFDTLKTLHDQAAQAGEEGKSIETQLAGLAESESAGKKKLEELTSRLQALGTETSRENLKAALDGYAAAAPAQVNMFAVIGVIAVVVGLGVGFISQSPFAGIAAVLIAGIAGYALAVRAAAEKDTVQRKAEIAAHAGVLNWEVDLNDLEGLRARLADCSREAAACEVRAVDTRKDLADEETKRGGLVSRLEARRAEADSLRKRFEDLGRDFHVASMEKAVEMLTQAKAAGDDLAQVESDIRGELDLDGVSGEALTEAIISEIDRIAQFAAGAPADLAGLSQKELDRRLEAIQKEADTAAARLEDLAAKDRLAEQDQREMERKLGGRTANEFHIELQDKELLLEELEKWREAAAIAHVEISKLQQGADGVMKSCVGQASQQLRGLTGGRYTSLSWTQKTLFESSPLAVVHETFGEKPLMWLSRGAQDMVWLAMRIAMAVKAFSHEPAFLLLDEPFLTLDAARTEKAIAGLFQYKPLQEWQIILLTKDQTVADMCVKAGAAVLAQNPDARQ